jgi:lysophospholipase L1-like esterase
MVFFEEDSSSYDMVIDAKAMVEELPGEGSSGIKVFRLDRYTDSLSIRLQQGDSLQGRFTLYGISLQTDDPGIVYHSIGVNGAKVSSFMRCQLLEEHLKALNPQLVILSLGTNDGYTRYFRYEPFRMEYDSLINRIGQAVPGAAILLTVPNDSYLYRRYINRNTEEIKKAIFELAQAHNAGVWDFYDVMGGLNSIIVWQRYGLAKRDRIHFTGKGYRLQGDLFFNALLQSYDNYLDMKDIDR